ncbi:MAG: AbrB/MazE/SpoVT family DNA-binding domain-containing protein [Ktedonobacterales bacterium]|nr:AbrB/MazE/SpoVT family DNA-binding domain-containing protein [Ktedonobacterales bacterium]
MQVQCIGQNLVIVLSPDVVQEQGLQEGDEVVVMKSPDRPAFDQALQHVLHDHAATFEFLKDK